MEHTSNFYMVLPSNVKTTGEFEKNKISHYHTPMPRPVQLTGGQWECALSEIFYPHSWYNIKGPLTRFEVKCGHGLRRSYKVAVSIAKGFYTPKSLADEMNSRFKAITTAPFYGRVKFLESVGIMKITLRHGETLTVHSHLAQLMGFDRKVFRYKAGTQVSANDYVFRSNRASDLNANLHQIYVYSDLVKETLVGDSYVPLLAVLNVRGWLGDNMHEVFQNPHYTETSGSTINSIEIALCDDQGELVPFLYGKVIVKLHFRRKKKDIFLN